MSLYGEGMVKAQQASIAVFGYRRPPSADVTEIVGAIDDLLQRTDAEPRKIHWSDNDVAFIDRIGVRIAIALLPPSDDDHYTHLVLAVGQAPGTSATDEMLSVSHTHLADRLVYRVKYDMPYDTIMRGETPEFVDETLIHSLYELLRQASLAKTNTAPANMDAQPTRKKPVPRIPAEERFDVILSDDVIASENATPSWIDRRAVPTQPLRLTVHTMALSVMLYTAPLGAFLFTYSMLRDVSSPSS